MAAHRAPRTSTADIGHRLTRHLARWRRELTPAERRILAALLQAHADPLFGAARRPEREVFTAAERRLIAALRRGS